MDLRKISKILEPKVLIDRVVLELNDLFTDKNFFDHLRQLTEPSCKLELILENISYMDFINLLLICGYDEAAQEFASYLTPPIDLTDLIDLSRCDPKNGHNQFFSFGGHNIDEEFATNTRDGKEIPTDSLSTPYDLSGDQRGYCYILINFFTIGTFKEMQRFRNIFHKLKFEVIFRKNLNKEEIIDDLTSISKEVLNEHKAFIFMYLGHGNENNVIHGFDSNHGNTDLEINQLLSLFISKNCPQLKRKPKIFFFNCCRGVNPLDNSKLFKERANQYRRLHVPKITDFVTCYSTLDGYEAKVDLNNGTVYGRVLVDTIIANVKYKDLNTILTKTNDEVRRKKKISDDDDQPFDWTQSSTRRVFFYLNISP